jgi:hypothetical protein
MAAMILWNFAANGAIGTAAATVDIKTTFNLNQTTANITLSIPNPTDTSEGRIVYINNIGTVWFTMLAERVEAWQSRQAIWNGTAWKWIGDQAGGSQIHIQKPTDEVVNNTGALQNDDHLTFPIWANETWIGDILVDYTSPVAQDIRFAITAPAGATCVYSVMDFDEGTAATANTACPTAIIMTTDSATDESATISFSVVNAGTAGNITLQWAQWTPAAVNTTVHDGSYLNAYRVRGADYAEVYYTDDGSINKGDIVALSGNGVSQVEKTSSPYDAKAIWIISTKPGIVVGEADGSWKAVIVWLAGRVPVKVTTKNGEIRPGDYITSSDIPWVGMKANEPGRVIGKALTTYVWAEIGTVMVFIENTFYDGIDEIEYSNYISSWTNSIWSSSLNRFSFMVWKSLGKIGSGNLNFGTSWIDAFDLSGMLSDIQGNIDTHSMQLWNLENSLSGISLSLETLRKWQETLQNPAITNITNTYVITNTGSDESIESIDEVNNLEIITDVIEYITNLLKESVQIIKEIVVLRIVALEAHIDQLFAKYARIDVIDSEKITTKKLCIDWVERQSCITEAELRKLLEQNNPSPLVNTPKPSNIENQDDKIPQSWASEDTKPELRVNPVSTPPSDTENVVSGEVMVPSSENWSEEAPAVQVETDEQIPSENSEKKEEDVSLVPIENESTFPSSPENEITESSSKIN